jgi:hypothetical protein
MEDNYYAMDDTYQNKNNYSLKMDLPKSPINKYSYEQLLELNKEYNKQLSKTLENLVLKKKKLILPKKDMQILNNLLLENYKYLMELIPKTILTIEFDNLYSTCLSILNDLSQFELKEIKIYQKLQRLKFMELKFHNLRFNGTRNDFLKADSLLDEMDSIQKDQIVAPEISLIDVSAILLYKAMIKFYLEDIELAENYAFEALDTLERNKDVDEQGNKKIEKISNILEFLVEIYDLKKDFNSAISCYEKAYYLNVGKYGVNSIYAQKYKRKKEDYENKVNKNNNNIYNSYDDSFYNDNNNFNNKQLMQGNIANAKGTAETFSFKIPITKNIEPMIISLYCLSDNNDMDRFSSELFLKNLYLDKNKLFSFYGMNDHSLQQNYFLYTDDTINDILENIRIEDNSLIVIDNPMVQAALINC